MPPLTPRAIHNPNSLADSLQLKRDFFAQHGPAVATQALVLAAALKRGGKLIAFGNGGSAADAQRTADYLISKGLPAVSLPALFRPEGPAFSSLYTSLRAKGDCALAISTSGNSPNIIETVELAQRSGDYVIAFTGNGGGRLRGLVPSALCVGDANTSHAVARIQEVHLMLVHELCSQTVALVKNER